MSAETRESDVALALTDLALTLAAEAAEVCAWFAPDYRPVAALRVAEKAFGEAYGAWYEFGVSPQDADAMEERGPWWRGER